MSALHFKTDRGRSTFQRCCKCSWNQTGRPVWAQGPCDHCHVFCVLMQSSCSVIRLVTLHISQKIVLTCFIKKKHESSYLILEKFDRKTLNTTSSSKLFFVSVNPDEDRERWMKVYPVIVQTYLQQIQQLSFYDSEHFKNLLLAPWSPQQLTKSHRVFPSISATSKQKVSKRTLSWVFFFSFWSEVFYFWHQTSPPQRKKEN